MARVIKCTMQSFIIVARSKLILLLNSLKMLQLLSDQHLKSHNFFLILINQPVQSGYRFLAQGSVSAI